MKIIQNPRINCLSSGHVSFSHREPGSQEGEQLGLSNPSGLPTKEEACGGDADRRFPETPLDP